MGTSDDSDCILFVSPGPSLVNPASGEGTRLQQLSKGLAERGWEVLALVPEAVSEEPEWMRQTYTYEQWSMPFMLDLNPSFVRALSRVLRREPVDVVHSSNGICTAALLSRLVGSETTVSYASQNVEAEHARDFVNSELPLYKRLLGPRLIPWIERATVECADMMTTVSEKDRETFAKRHGIPFGKIWAIPTGTQTVDSDSLEPRHAVRKRLSIDADVPVAVFHGSYSHPPNEEAFELIAEEIAPELDLRGEGVQFLLVGKGVPDVDREDVAVAGFVDDLFSVLNAADFAVVPIRHGGGTKTKLYDYISLGLPIVTTAKGAEGIDLVAGKHALVTDEDVASFVDAIVSVASEHSRRESFAEELVALSDELTWERSVDRLDEFYRTRTSGRV